MSAIVFCHTNNGASHQSRTRMLIREGSRHACDPLNPCVVGVVGPHFLISPLAIVGLGCRFPSNANIPAEYFKNLLDKVDSVIKPPSDRPHNGQPSGYLTSEVRDNMAGA